MSAEYSCGVQLRTAMGLIVVYEATPFASDFLEPFLELVKTRAYGNNYVAKLSFYTSISEDPDDRIFRPAGDGLWTAHKDIYDVLGEPIAEKDMLDYVLSRFRKCFPLPLDP